ncbi:MAG TPA: T9SS type A sorting domain-containing protein [Bacteroidota bacterium]|nr:T9SS type A sorting domain-containing protein [Bacteroidota bacterium]
MKKLILILVFFLSLHSLYSQWELVPGWLHDAPSISYIVSYNDTIMAKLEGPLLISLNNGKNWDTAIIDNDYIWIHKIINNKLIVGTNHGCYISTDMGNSWIPKNNGINFTVKEISFDNDKIYINAPENGIFYSSDWGDHWMPIDIKGLPYSDIALYDVRNNEIWASSTKEEKIGSVTYYYGGLFTSTDFGENWQPVMRNSDTLQVRYFSLKGDSIFAIEYNSWTLIMSPDNGKSWSNVKITTGNTKVYSMFLKDSIIFVSGFDGNIYLSTNSGKDWTAKGNELGYIYDFTYNGHYFFAIDEDAHTIYSSTDMGASWEKIYQSIAYANPTALSAADGIIYAGTPQKLAVSSDQGVTWVWNENGLVKSYITAVEAAGDNIFVGNFSGLFMSSDRGMHWIQCASDTTKKLSNKTVYEISIDGNNVVASISDGVLLSTDMGITWQFRSFAKNHYVLPVAIRGNTIFAGTWGLGLYKSTDLGNTWQQYKFTDQQINAISLLDNYVYVGVSDGLVISEDFGETWVKTDIRFRYGNLVENWINAIANDGENLYLKCYHNGVFISKDKGKTWEAHNSGMQVSGTTDRTHFAINGEYIFVNLYSISGLKSFYRAKISDLLTGVDVKEYQNQYFNPLFPNPAQDYLNASSYIGWQYQIYDMLGNCFQSRLIESEKINISSLPTGFYTIRFYKDGKQVVEKIIKN